MSDIVITLPADASEEEIARVRAAFPDASFEAATTPPPPGVSFEDQVASAVQAVRLLPGRLAEAWTAAGGWELLLWLAVALAIGYAAERVLRALILDRLGRPPAGAPLGLLRQRLGRAFVWALTRLGGLLVFAVVSVLVARSLPIAPVEEARVFGRGLLAAIVFGRFIYLFLKLTAAPHAPERRLVNFTDAEAHHVLREGILIAVFAAIAATARAALGAAAGNDPETALARAVIALLMGLLTIRFFLAIRQPLRGLMQRREAAAKDSGSIRERLARNLAWIYVVIVAIDMTVKILGALGVLGPGAASGAGASVLLLVIAPLLVAGLGVVSSELSEEERKPMALGVLALAEGVVVLLTAILLMLAWGIDPFMQPEGSGLLAILPAVVKTAAIVVVGLALWRAVTAVLGEKADEEDSGEVDDSHGEMGGTGDRIATILPILRGFALAIIVLTTALTALSALGIDVAPLIASAGILGLAIGFGAQTLVTDVISGMFYLYEDALRVGEYIETESGGGSVEKISLRSATLRHPRGALITVPFSKMGTVRNNSRDWVVMKFSFRVPADTDVEQVRKIIKKVGAEMTEDPELEGKILAPLKSQGAVGITGRSYEIGCKFMSLPGEQFAIRRKAFVLVQRALKENNIELAAQDLDLSAAMR